MKKRKTVVLTLLTILSLSLPVLVSTPVNITDNDYPLVFEVNDLRSEDLSVYVETSMDKNVPIVVYSLKPVETRLVQITESSCSLDFETGEFKEEVTASYVEQNDLYEYHVIEAGYPMKHKTFGYLVSNGNSSYFEAALQDEISSLGATHTEDNQREFISSTFAGDPRTSDMYWLRDHYLTGVITAIDNDHDGWTWKQRYQHEVHRSVYDYATGYKWWTVDTAITTYADTGDYKEDYGNWVGPWIYNRQNYIYFFTGTEWDHGPTTDVGSWSYSFSASVRITPDGPTLGFGASQTFSQSQVKITDNSDEDMLVWLEEFPPESGPAVPDYFYYPFSMIPPISASHANYKSYRAALFYHSPTSSFDFNWDLWSRVHYDAGFAWFFLLFWTRYTRSIVDYDEESYPATGT